MDAAVQMASDAFHCAQPIDDFTHTHDDGDLTDAQPSVIQYDTWGTTRGAYALRPHLDRLGGTPATQREWMRSDAACAKRKVSPVPMQMWQQ